MLIALLPGDALLARGQVEESYRGRRLSVFGPRQHLAVGTDRQSTGDPVLEAGQLPAGGQVPLFDSVPADGQRAAIGREGEVIRPVGNPLEGGPLPARGQVPHLDLAALVRRDRRL